MFLFLSLVSTLAHKSRVFTHYVLLIQFNLQQTVTLSPGRERTPSTTARACFNTQSCFSPSVCCNRRNPAVCLSIKWYSARFASQISTTKNISPTTPSGNSTGYRIVCPKLRYKRQGACGKHEKRTKAESWGTFSFKFPWYPNQQRAISVPHHINVLNGMRKDWVKSKFCKLNDLCADR